MGEQHRTNETESNLVETRKLELLREVIRQFWRYSSELILRLQNAESEIQKLEAEARSLRKELREAQAAAKKRRKRCPLRHRLYDRGVPIRDI